MVKLKNNQIEMFSFKNKRASQNRLAFIVCFEIRTKILQNKFLNFR